MVKRTASPTSQQMNGNVEVPDEYAGIGEDHSLSFDIQDVVDLSVAGVDVSHTDSKVQNGALLKLKVKEARCL